MQGVADVTVVQALPDQAEQLDVGVVEVLGPSPDGGDAAKNLSGQLG